MAAHSIRDIRKIMNLEVHTAPVKCKQGLMSVALGNKSIHQEDVILSPCLGALNGVPKVEARLLCVTPRGLNPGVSHDG
jgi:hypothetical protein